MFASRHRLLLAVTFALSCLLVVPALAADGAGNGGTLPCNAAPSLAELFAPQGELAPALNQTPVSAGVAAPALLAMPPFQKTCRCSCGFPCQTNDDCGPGGICGAGITCCVAPMPLEGPVPTLEGPALGGIRPTLPAASS